MSSLEASVSVGSIQSIVALQGRRQLSSHSSGTLGWSCSLLDGSTSLSLGVVRQLSTHSEGQVSSTDRTSLWPCPAAPPWILRLVTLRLSLERSLRGRWGAMPGCLCHLQGARIDMHSTLTLGYVF